MVGSRTDLLIRCEGNTYLAVYPFRMLLELTHGLNNRRHTRFVIRTQQRRPIGHNQFLPHIVIQLREHIRREHDPLCLIQHDITTRIGNDTRFHILARQIRTGI